MCRCVVCLYRSFASHGVLVSVTDPDSISVPITRSAARSATGGASADLAMRLLHVQATATLEPHWNLATAVYVSALAKFVSVVCCQALCKAFVQASNLDARKA